MKILKLFPLLLPVFLSGQFCLAQNTRLNSLAGFTLTIPDRDNSLNLYDFGKNPAWLSEDEQLSRIEFNSSFKNGYGDYRRFYSASSINNINTEFKEIQNLGRAGVFSGMASYNYEIRKNYNRSIQYDPYAGEGFFISDTNTGNFTYNGPTVGAEYSYKLFPGILFGASIDYRILDGLKKQYSMPHTNLRSFGVTTGIALKMSEQLNLGITYRYFDSREEIESQSNGLTQVEIFISRGEKFSFIRIGNNVNEKIKGNKNNFGVQLLYNPVPNFEAALKGDYSVSGTGLILQTSQNIDYEDSYADFKRSSFDFRIRYFADNLTFGLQLLNSQNNSWTRNTVRDLLIWKWKLTEWLGGLGITWNSPDSKWLITGQYNLNKITADSLKFIDSRIAFFNTINHIAGVGTEYFFDPDFGLRIGWRASKYNYDLVNGGSNVDVNIFSTGCSIKLINYILDVGFSYENIALKNSGAYNKIFFELSITTF